MQIVAKRKVAETARVLMVISITLLVYGIILNVSTILGLVDSPKRGKITDEGNSTVSITPADSGDIKVDDSSKNRVADENLDSKNLALRNEIEKEFSVMVRYGNETEGYAVGGVLTEPITDSIVINETLNSLYNTLSLYPKGIFKEIREGGIPLTIILVNNYSEYSITGVTDSSYDYAHISIAAVYDFSDSFFMNHIIIWKDICLRKKQIIIVGTV